MAAQNMFPEKINNAAIFLNQIRYIRYVRIRFRFKAFV